jgi:hypothetical protein
MPRLSPRPRPGPAAPGRRSGQRDTRYRQRSYTVRAVAYLPPPVAAAGGWLELGEPGRLPGLAELAAAAWLAWPVLVVVMLMLPAGLKALLVPRRARARHRRLQREQGLHRPPIPVHLYRTILNTDRRRCAFCRRRLRPQVDHLRPYAAGGLHSLFNLMVLCQEHNRVKSYWEAWDGRSYYRPFPGAGNRQLAARIVRAERRRRLNPLRWLRIAWVYG